MLQENTEIYRGLQYPFGRTAKLGTEEHVEIADGIYWVRFPMPMALDHINVWLLEDGDGWTVVDTGLNLADAREQWEGIFERVLKGRPIHRVICTHMHPDHVGLAGWLCERFACELWMSRTEYLYCRMLVADTGRTAPDEALAEAEAKALDARLQAWIADLPDRQREALTLSRFDGLSHAEIADVMGVSPRTVNNHLVQALRTLRDRLHHFAPNLLNR